MGGAGDDIIRSTLGNDYLDGGSGFDFLSAGAGKDTLKGGADNDELRAGTSNDSLSGDDGNDRHFGDAGNDTLFGGAGNDFLSGGSGRDYLSGGTGKDIFAFTTRANSRTNVDTLADVNVRDDQIYLDNAAFKALGRKGSLKKPAKLEKKMFSVGLTMDSKHDHIIYDKKGGVLYYDDDGTGAHKAIPIAFIGKKLKLAYHDFYVI
jgi:Ca2+-binding RTX toxin-like protein